jgi:hypothetical protein
MNIKNLGIFGVVLLVIMCIVMSSGCVSSEQSQTQTQSNSTPAIQKNILVCPNPDCYLHDPNHYTGYGRGIRPITCVPIVSGNQGVAVTTGYHYVCEYCGHQWDVEK